MEQASGPVVTSSSDPYLIIQTESETRHLPLVGTDFWTIGRSQDNSIVLLDWQVSRRHAVLSRNKTGDFCLLDLNSRNGSFVNKNRINSPITLRNGDRLIMGQIKLELRAPSETLLVESSGSSKTVLMTQLSKTQGKLWQAALVSQGISVTWEPSTANLTQVINHIEESGQKLPDLLLLDIRALKPSPYAFCRWFRKHYPDLKIVLTSATVSPARRQWVMDQGAIDLLPGFQAENLLADITAVVEQIKRILEVLDWQVLEQQDLLPALASISHRENLPETPASRKEQ